MTTSHYLNECWLIIEPIKLTFEVVSFFFYHNHVFYLDNLDDKTWGIKIVEDLALLKRDAAMFITEGRNIFLYRAF